MKRQVPPGFDRRADVVVVGASAGGIDAMFTLFEGLPVPFRAALLVVLHLPQEFQSRLPEVFSARLGISVEEARPGGAIRGNAMFVAPSGYHLLVEDDRTFALSCDEPVFFSRPSIDVLMASCADAYGPTAAALLLTGANEDGARGIAHVREAGGVTAVQDPHDATHPTMPRAGVELGRPDFVLPLSGLRQLLHLLIQ